MLTRLISRLYQVHNSTLSKVFVDMVEAGACREDISLAPWLQPSLELKTDILLLDTKMVTVTTRVIGEKIVSTVAREVNGAVNGQSSPQQEVN